MLSVGLFHAKKRTTEFSVNTSSLLSSFVPNHLNGGLVCVRHVGPGVVTYNYYQSLHVTGLILCRGGIRKDVSWKQNDSQMTVSSCNLADVVRMVALQDSSLCFPVLFPA